jgi:predicted dehydrogenase
MDRNDLFLAAAKDFLEAVMTRRPPACGLDDATEVMLVVDAIKESMGSSGRSVDVPHRRSRAGSATEGARG